MKRSSRLFALALPVLWGCASDPVAVADAPAQPRLDLSAAADAPLVFTAENSGAGITPPTFPDFADLPVSPLLPDPFRPYMGGPRDISMAGWQNRRAEFKAVQEKYEIGPKPAPSEVAITASYTPTNATAGTLRVLVRRLSTGDTLTLTSAVALPTTITGPVPAIIGMNSPSGGIPADIFTSRNIARITYSHNNVTTYGRKAATDAFYRLYPEYAGTGVSGQYSAWSWGVSRLIDGLQLLASQPGTTLPINTSRLAVAGCSYAGKMALYAGALDERIALTLPIESGGGGAPAWRVNHAIEPNGRVEKTDNTDGSWFINNVLKAQFRGDSVYKLPGDHHELMAMVAPRGLLVTGNTDFEWLGNEANYVSSRAAQATYETLGVGDRFGFYIDGQHGHCQIPTAQRPVFEAFVERFLLDQNANTAVRVHPFGNLDYQSWMPWANSPSMQQVAMDVQPGQISVSTTAVVNVVLYGAAGFDAAAVDAANVRLVVNGGNDDNGLFTNTSFPQVMVYNVPPVAPIMRGTMVNSSVADVNGDGRPDRVIGFSTAALRAAGYLPGYSTLWLRPATAPYAWMAFDVTGNFVTRPRVVQ